MNYITKLSEKFAGLLVENAEPYDEIYEFLEHISDAMVDFDFEIESQIFSNEMGADRDDFSNETNYKSKVIHHFLFTHIGKKKDRFDNKCIYQKYIHREFENNIGCLLREYIKSGLLDEVKLFEKFIGTISSSGYYG